MQKSDLTPGSHSTRKISILFDEEIANSISHGLGLLALGMVPVLVLSAMRIGSIHFIVGAECVWRNGSSTLSRFDALPLAEARASEAFLSTVRSQRDIPAHRRHLYTIRSGVLRGPWGWTLLTIVWVLAVVGITTKALVGLRYSWISMTLLSSDGLVGCL